MTKKKRRNILDVLIPKKRKSRRVSYLEREIIRKNEAMREMKKRNDLLLRTTMKQSHEIVRLQNKIKEMNESQSRK
ncbi:MAG: hypothetical protein ACLFNK_00645 [Candidatus Woesearchaeota archaeon]